MDVGNFGFVVAGLIVGFIVGMTGVGGGSLMTPILLWFGINPATAVGTDLLYAAITKSGGVLVHGKNKNIDWTITGWLTLGSVPAVLLTLWFLKSLHTDPSAMNEVIKQALGVVLLLTPTVVDPARDLLAPAVAISTLELLFKMGGSAWGAISDLTMAAVIALGVYVIFALVRLPFLRKAEARRRAQAQAQADAAAQRDDDGEALAQRVDDREQRHVPPPRENLRVEPRI